MQTISIYNYGSRGWMVKSVSERKWFNSQREANIWIKSNYPTASFDVVRPNHILRKKAVR